MTYTTSQVIQMLEDYKKEIIHELSTVHAPITGDDVRLITENTFLSIVDEIGNKLSNDLDDLEKNSVFNISARAIK